MELMKPALAGPVTDELGQAAPGQRPNLGWKPRRLGAINGTTISHAAGPSGHLTHKRHAGVAVAEPSLRFSRRHL